MWFLKRCKTIAVPAALTGADAASPPAIAPRIWRAKSVGSEILMPAHYPLSDVDGPTSGREFRTHMTHAIFQPGSLGQASAIVFRAIFRKAGSRASVRRLHGVHLASSMLPEFQ